MLRSCFVGSALAFASVVSAQVNLATAYSFAVLAGSTVTNTGTSTIDGNVGVYPGSAVVGFPSGLITNGMVHSADAQAMQAQLDVETAFEAAASEPPTLDLSGQNLGTMNLAGGVYFFSSSAQLTGELTLNGNGDPDSVWIFQINSTLTTAGGSVVSLINEASPCNIFWIIGTSATLDTATTFAGNILALASITMITGSSINGGLYARNGAVTLGFNNVSSGRLCSATTPTSPTSPTGPPPSTTTTPGTGSVTGSVPITAITGGGIPGGGGRGITGGAGAGTMAQTGAGGAANGAGGGANGAGGPGAGGPGAGGPGAGGTGAGGPGAGGPGAGGTMAATGPSAFRSGTGIAASRSESTIRRPLIEAAGRHILTEEVFTVICDVAPTTISSHGQTFFIETPCTTVLTATCTPTPEDLRPVHSSPIPHEGHVSPTPYPWPDKQDIYQTLPEPPREPATESTSSHQPYTPVEESAPPPSDGPAIVTAAAAVNWPHVAAFAAVAFFPIAIRLL